jgi:hypothetical protein
VSPDAAGKPSLWRRLYRGWLQIAARFGEVQTLVILTLVYSLVLGPIGLAIAAARRDLLHKRGLRGDGSVWNDADSVTEPDLERAKRLF